MPDDQPYQYSRCQGAGCRRLILWVTTDGGKRMPLDPTPHPAGTVVLHRADGRPVRARVLGGHQLPAQETAHQAHWVTCPASSQYRARRGRGAPRCAACQGPMPADLAHLEHWTTHPCCDPAEALAAARWRALLAAETRGRRAAA